MLDSIYTVITGYPMFFWVTAIVGVMLVGISKGGFGGGLGILATPMLGLTVSVGDALAILLPLLIAADILSVTRYRNRYDGPIIKLLLPGALIGILLGYLLFSVFQSREPVLKAVMGYTVIAFVIYQVGIVPFFRSQLIAAFPPWGGTLLSTLSGFLSTVANIGAPPIYIYLLPRKLHREIYVGTLVVFFFAVNLVKLIPYYFLGLLNAGNFILVMLLLPFTFFGVWIGAWLNKVISPNIFTGVIYLMMILTGVQLITGYNLFYSWL